MFFSAEEDHSTDVGALAAPHSPRHGYPPLKKARSRRRHGPERKRRF
jgi:hypothetical protein